MYVVDERKGTELLVKCLVVLAVEHSLGTL